MRPHPFIAAMLTSGKTIELDPSFSKGYARKGAALHGLRRFPDAVMAYESGLQAEPNNAACVKGLSEVKRAMDTDSSSPFAPGGNMGLGKIFSDPSMISKLENHPKTSALMKDATFRANMLQLQASGGRNMSTLMGDPRTLTALGVLMGIDIVRI